MSTVSTYRIERFYQSDEHETEVIATGLSEADAKAHCKSPESSSKTASSAEARARTEQYGPWFEGFAEDSQLTYRTDRAEYRWHRGNETVNIYALDDPETEIDMFSFGEPPEDFDSFEAQVLDREQASFNT